MKRALVLGGTGLVGQKLVERLARDATYGQVTMLVRRTVEAPANVQVVVVDFASPETYTPHLAVDDVFCCLGTTIKQAGSQEAFRRVDHDLPLALARAGVAAGAQRFLVITAVGSDAGSRIFYNRVKGELESALRTLPFPGGVKVFHPSMLLGHRQEPRAAERVMVGLFGATKPLFFGALKKYRGIDADDVAAAMVHVAHSDDNDVRVYEGQALFDAARAA